MPAKRDLILIGMLVLALAVVGADLWWSEVFSPDPDELDVVAEEDGAEEARGARRKDADIDDTPRDVETSQNQAEDETEAAPAALDPFGVPYAVIEGRVMSRDRKPVANARLRLNIDSASSSKQTIRGEQVGEVLSDDKGFFRFVDVETHDLLALTVFHEDFATQFVPDLKPAPEEVKNLVIQLEAGFELFGRVTEADSDVPVPDAEIVVYDLVHPTLDFEDCMERRTRSDAEGRYRIKHLLQGFKRVVARKEGYANDTIFQKRLNQVTSRGSWDFALSPGLAIEGRVVDADRNPIEGATVTIRTVLPGKNGKKGHFEPRKSDAGGRYRFQGLPEGFYSIRATKPGYRIGTVFRRDEQDGELRLVTIGRSAVNASAGDKGVDLVLEKGAIVSGTVIDAESGEPLQAFEIVASPVEHLLARSAPNTERYRETDGRFEFTSTMVDSFQDKLWIFALVPGYAGGSTEIRRSDFQGSGKGRLDGVVIEVKRGGGLAVIIKDADGQPISRARVTAFPSKKISDQERQLFDVHRVQMPREGNSALSGADGRAVVSGLLPGYYRLRVEHRRFATAFPAALHELRGSDVMDLGEVALFRGATVSGLVVDSQGKSMEGCGVQLLAKEKGGETFRVTTGITGTFEFQRVPPGAYNLAVVNVRGELVLNVGSLGQISGPSSKNILVADGERLTHKLRVKR